MTRCAVIGTLKHPISCAGCSLFNLSAGNLDPCCTCFTHYRASGHMDTASCSWSRTYEFGFGEYARLKLISDETIAEAIRSVDKENFLVLDRGNLLQVKYDQVKVECRE